MKLSYYILHHIPGFRKDLAVKSEVSPSSGSVALRQLSPIHKKGS